jgi:hypothetical protein
MMGTTVMTQNAKKHKNKTKVHFFLQYHKKTETEIFSF